MCTHAGLQRGKKGIDLEVFVCLFVRLSFFLGFSGKTVQRTEHGVPPGSLVVDSYVRSLPGSRAEPH